MDNHPCWVLIPLRIGQIISAGEATFTQLVEGSPNSDTRQAIVAIVIARCRLNLFPYSSGSFGMPFSIIYALTIAGLSMLLALLCLTPFTRRFRAYTDFLLSALWIVAFGFLLRYQAHYCLYTEWQASCHKRWGVSTAFGCISAVLWLTNAVFVSQAYHACLASAYPLLFCFTYTLKGKMVPAKISCHWTSPYWPSCRWCTAWVSSYSCM